MKTIQEASREFASDFVDNECRNIVIKSFTEAVKFAEEWLPIERDDNGEMTPKQVDEIKNNCPFLIKDDYCTDDYFSIEASSELSDYYLYDTTFTYWRPLNRK